MSKGGPGVSLSVSSLYHRAILSVLIAATALFFACSRRPLPRTPPASTATPLLPDRAQSFAAFAGVSAELAKVATAYPSNAGETADSARPFDLTASDGAGLRLVSLRSRAVITGPLAMTQLHLTFVNPEQRQREGRFSITLPPDASISRFAMKLPQGWQEAEVVERQRARQVYEDFLHRGQDPALLERKAGNRFRARVFPIPGGATKELIISYAEPLADPDQAYRLRLRGLPAIDEVDLAAVVAWPDGARRLVRRRISFRREKWTPDRDFVVAAPPAGITALRSGDLLVARARATQAPSSRGSLPLDSLVVLVDTSASRAPAFAAQVETLGALIRGLEQKHEGHLSLKVVCFDQVAEVVFEGQAASFDEGQLNRILARRPLGASNLELALQQVASAAGNRYHRVLLVTDGVPTAGASEAVELKRAVRRLRASVARLDVLVVGGLRDEQLMRQLVVGNLEQDGKVLDDELSTAELVRRLGSPVFSADLAVDLDDGEELGIWPRRVEGLQPDDSALVFVKLPPGAPRSPLLSLRVGDQQQRLAVYDISERALIERALAEARIRELEMRGAVEDTSTDQRKKLKAEIIGLSTKHRVLSEHTAMLVLETEGDYARYGIDRRALADILVVDDNGLRQLERVAPVTLAARPTLHRPVERVRQPVDGDEPVERPTEPPRAPTAALSADQFVPGDPEVVVDAPADAVKVTLLFPTGTIKACTRDAGGNKWRASFLIPEGTADGIYSIRVLITRRDGEQLTRTVRYQVDGTEPKVRVELLPERARPGSLVTIKVTPLRLEPSARSTNDAAAPSGDIGDPTFDVRVLQDVARATSRLPDGSLHELVAEGNGRFAGRFAAPQKAGRYRINVVVNDYAGNKVARELELVVDPDAAASAVEPATTPSAASSSRSKRALSRPPPRVRQRNVAVEALDADPFPAEQKMPAVTGRLATTLALLDRGKGEEALLVALRWRIAAPGDVLALVALGEALEAQGGTEVAARVYGSIIDLFPSRADMRRFAAGRLEALGRAGYALAVDSYKRAAEQRPDHESSHHLLGMAQLRVGAYEAAIETFEAGLKRRYHRRRRGVADVLIQDLGLAAAALVAKQPGRRAELARRLTSLGAAIARKPSLRFLLTWETDANDVDLHLYDGQGNHASYKDPELASGGALLADVVTGYGPELFRIEAAEAYPYRIRVHFFGRGPMGYGMGQVVIVRHDGAGGLSFEDRPFVLMSDRAFLELGSVTK